MKLKVFLGFNILLSVVFLAAFVNHSANAASTAALTPSKEHPNIIFILTDDLDRKSFNRHTMPNTISYIKDQGTTFQNQVFPMATCCPSRANFMSGQYNHNNTVFANGGGHGGYDAYYANQRDSGISLGYNIGSFMQRGGYRTAFIGKYMNEYGDSYIPGGASSMTTPEWIPGWSKWFVPIQNRSQKYYNYKVKFNEPVEDFAPGIFENSPTLYTDDVVLDKANKVVNYSAPLCNYSRGCSPLVKTRQRQTFSERIFVNQALEFLKDQENGRSPLDRAPSFIWYSTDSPHGTGDNTIFNHKSASWGGPSYNPNDSNRFNLLKLNRSGSFDELNIKDKPLYIRNLPRLSRVMLSKMLAHQKARWRSLYSLDRELKRLYDYLDASGKSENTVLVFTTDNGYMSGQHRIPKGKTVPYREVSEFPIIYRGPGIAKGKSVTSLAVNLDFVPTVIDIANIPENVVADPFSGRTMGLDGFSLMPYMTTTPNGYYPTRKAVLLESIPRSEKDYAFRPYKGVRTSRYVYIRYYRSDFDSLYNCDNTYLYLCIQGRAELYDLKTDPQQKNNLVTEIEFNRYNKNWVRTHKVLLNNYTYLQNKLNSLEHCSGVTCSS